MRPASAGKGARMSAPLFEKVAVIGLGLIGGSFAAAIKKRGLAKTVVAGARSARTREKGVALGIVDDATDDFAAAVRDADLVFIAVPVSAMADNFRAMAT